MHELNPEDYPNPTGYVRHIRDLRVNGSEYSEALGDEEAAAELAEYNAKALQAATLMENVADNLEFIAEISIPCDAGVDIDGQRMASIARAQAEWYSDYAEALKEQAEYLRER